MSVSSFTVQCYFTLQDQNCINCIVQHNVHWGHGGYILNESTQQHSVSNGLSTIQQVMTTNVIRYNLHDVLKQYAQRAWVEAILVITHACSTQLHKNNRAVKQIVSLKFQQHDWIIHQDDKRHLFQQHNLKNVVFVSLQGRMDDNIPCRVKLRSHRYQSLERVFEWTLKHGHEQLNFVEYQLIGPHYSTFCYLISVQATQTKSCRNVTSSTVTEINYYRKYYNAAHLEIIFSFWSYPSFLHDAGRWVIKTIGLC